MTRDEYLKWVGATLLQGATSDELYQVVATYSVVAYVVRTLLEEIGYDDFQRRYGQDAADFISGLE